MRKFDMTFTANYRAGGRKISDIKALRSQFISKINGVASLGLVNAKLAIERMYEARDVTLRVNEEQFISFMVNYFDPNTSHDGEFYINSVAEVEVKPEPIIIDATV